MKLSPLLSDFLVSNKHIDLAGIGRFTIDNSGTINFEQNAAVREDINLVNYIVDRTGKMKSLISADLESHLELARQFLNIGKPYLFEGIGTLAKNKFGRYEFIQANSIAEKKENAGEGRDTTSTTENSFTDYEEMFSPKKPGGSAAKKIVTWLIAIAGLSLAVFGGYLVYTKTKNKSGNITSKKTEPLGTVQQPQVTPVKDAIAPANKDSIDNIRVTVPNAGVGTYRFVIEQASKTRAFYRYNKLRKDFINVQMDTKDSVLFKLFFVLPATPADTAHKRDSLQRLYGTRGRTIVELN